MAQVRIIVDNIAQWQHIDADTLQILLTGAYNSFARMTGFELNKNIIVTNELATHAPMIFYPTGELQEDNLYRIALNIPDGDSWGKIIHQFSHELCHAYCHYERVQAYKHKWFEEALGEAAAMSNLRYIHQHWEALPFVHHPQINARRSCFNHYLEELLSDIPKNIPVASILQYIDDHLTVLEVKSITQIRDEESAIRIRAVAYYLCERVFFHDISRWKAINYFNEWDVTADKNFIDFIRNWVRHGDENVRAIATTFGIFV